MEEVQLYKLASLSQRKRCFQTGPRGGGSDSQSTKTKPTSQAAARRACILIKLVATHWPALGGRVLGGYYKAFCDYSA